MAKVYGKAEGYSLVRCELSRVIVSYGFCKEADGNHATWYEAYFDMLSPQKPTIEQVKDAIISDINSRTDEKIISGLAWRNIPVWLSTENQFNFKSAYDLAVQTNGATLPVTFKMGELDGEPVYHTFETMDEATDFYTSAVAFIHQALEDGWAEKDGIDWKQYEEYLL